jgi:DHA3 family macrolide efflux protein-like MFS transporter
MQIARKRPAGMPAFTIVWFGQMVSFLGTGMTRFALTIWAWQITGSATALALVAFFAYGPTVVMSPIAGALVDRWNRKFVMMLSDLAAGVSTVAILLLYTTGHLQMWHLYVAGAAAGAFEAFQWPAYSAAITTMLPKERYGRANGMWSLLESVSGIGAPILAGILIGLIGIGGVMTIDVLTFVFAIGTLLSVNVPQPVESAAGHEARGSLWKESAYGFRYVLQRPGLLGLQLIFLNVNLLGPFVFTLINPMILARTGDNAEVLATVLSITGVGGVLGGLVMSAWGGPRRRIHAILGGIALESLLGAALMGLGRTLAMWATAGFFSGFLIPIINGSSQAIWQSKVVPDVQGRVFAVRRLIAQIAGPLGILIAGPLADKLFEPAMQPGGALAGTFGGLVGTGPGAGMALLMVLAGVMSATVSLSGYLIPIIRDVETILPDHDEVAMGLR